MATVYKIHPAIGIARVGNSPAEFFIGPERTREVPNPKGDSRTRSPPTRKHEGGPPGLRFLL